MSSFSEKIIPVINNLQAALSNLEKSPYSSCMNTLDALIGLLMFMPSEERYKYTDLIIKKLMEISKNNP